MKVGIIFGAEIRTISINHSTGQHWCELRLTNVTDKETKHKFYLIKVKSKDEANLFFLNKIN